MLKLKDNYTYSVFRYPDSPDSGEDDEEDEEVTSEGIESEEIEEDAEETVSDKKTRKSWLRPQTPIYGKGPAYSESSLFFFCICTKPEHITNHNSCLFN